ncbi:MAG: hypothetical protein WC322_03305 [Candidatus Paceibacterota bacterium]|jgi:hypothetical protein
MTALTDIAARLKEAGIECGELDIDLIQCLSGARSPRRPPCRFRGPQRVCRGCLERPIIALAELLLKATYKLRRAAEHNREVIRSLRAKNRSLRAALEAHEEIKARSCESCEHENHCEIFAASGYEPGFSCSEWEAKG